MKNTVFAVLTFAAVLSLQVLPARAAEIASEPAALEYEEPDALTSLGEFKLTAYCGCAKCNGKNPGIDCFGNPLKVGTIAVDPKVIPLGSKVMIDGQVYTARDTGGKWVKGNHIDIYMESHRAASDFGLQRKKVYLIK